MIVLEIGNGVESTRHSRPPLKIACGGLLEELHTCASAAAASSPGAASAGFSGGTAPRAK